MGLTKAIPTSFQKGHDRGGRPPDAGQTGDEFRETALKQAKERGASDEELEEIANNKCGGLVGYLRWLSVAFPSSFATLLAKVLPLRLAPLLEMTAMPEKKGQETPES